MDVKVQKAWPYFPRFDAKGLSEGLPWKILELRDKGTPSLLAPPYA